MDTSTGESEATRGRPEVPGQGAGHRHGVRHRPADGGGEGDMLCIGSVPVLTRYWTIEGRNLQAMLTDGMERVAM